MIEINGWISINFSTDGEVGMPDRVILEITRTIDALTEYNQFFKLSSLNGSHFLSIGLYHNHDVGYSDLVYNLLIDICKLAPGTYGIVYIRNDEDVDNYNKFKILKIAKGQLSVEEDHLLSPCNPIIED